jgi:SAM-dependent methyltransferase
VIHRYPLPIAAASLPRAPYHGVLQIFCLNWPYYFTGAVMLIALAATLALLPLNGILIAAALTAIAVDAYFIAASLLISHYVYDRSELYRFEWLKRLFPVPPRRWVNIHSGLDETTALLRALFPDTFTNTFDIYDPAVMTEGSIARALKQKTGDLYSEHADYARLPLNYAECDAIFLLLAAHEIREPEGRLRFFRELQRVTAPGGLVVIAEHLRDAWNFAAFGPNVWHVLPRPEWLRLAREAHFTVQEEFKVTPFVRVFVLRAKA